MPQSLREKGPADFCEVSGWKTDFVTASGDAFATRKVACILPCMALQDLVRYFARRRAERPNCTSLSQMAERHNWTQAEVLAFLRCDREPSRKMLRELATELDVSVEELQRILES